MLLKKDSGNAVVISRIGQTWLSETLNEERCQQII